jgi:choline dehydrogenase-like flavoprotein
VLPYFRKVERDLDCDGPLHGKEGRIPIRRIPREHWCEHARAAASAFEQAGSKYLPDQNGVFEDGHFLVTISNRDKRRVSAAIGYLDRATRERANRTVSTETSVRALLFEGRVCTGIGAGVGGHEEEYRGREVILCTGAIHICARWASMCGSIFRVSGRVQLASTDPDAELMADFSLLSDSRDVEQLMDGFRRLGAMQQSAALRAVTTDPFPASYGDRVRPPYRRREHEEPHGDAVDCEAAVRASRAAELTDRSLRGRRISLR